MNTNSAGWNNPVINNNAHRVYEDLYGENGAHYLAILESSPREIAVISRMIAYLTLCKEMKQDGH